MKYEISDGGKPDTLHENNLDCTVRALAIASGLSYEIAYILYEDSGRRPGCPAPTLSGLEEYWSQGFGQFEKVSNAIDPSALTAYASHNQMTVSQFIRRYPTGRFIIRIKAHGGGRVKHVIAVVDGVAFDNQEVNARKRVETAYQIKPKL